MSSSANPFDPEGRVATNQILFREFNEQVDELKGRMGFVVPVEWICECANDTCVQPIQMSAHEYEQLHAEKAWFFVAPSKEHVWPNVEHIVARNTRYWVVEKTGHA